MVIGLTSLRSFNPYRVFKFVATSLCVWRRFLFVSVSIPIGFSSSLQLVKGAGLQTGVYEFQSLSGFQVRCNKSSIWCPQCLRKVSIPIGFSSSLQLSSRIPNPLDTSKFQSLSGFQVRCNVTDLTLDGNRAEQFQSLSGFQVRCNVML